MGQYTAAVPEDWKETAKEIEETTVLHPRQAQVAALAAGGVTRRTIAKELEISENTVDEHQQKIRDLIRRARYTLSDPRLETFRKRTGVETLDEPGDEIL